MVSLRQSLTLTLIHQSIRTHLRMMNGKRYVNKLNGRESDCCESIIVRIRKTNSIVIGARLVEPPVLVVRRILDLILEHPSIHDHRLLVARVHPLHLRAGDSVLVLAVRMRTAIPRSMTPRTTSLSPKV